MANRVCVMKNYCVYISSPSLAKRHASRAHKQEAVSDWLNPHSLGTMSAFGCIENLAFNLFKSF